MTRTSDDQPDITDFVPLSPERQEPFAALVQALQTSPEMAEHLLVDDWQLLIDGTVRQLANARIVTELSLLAPGVDEKAAKLAARRLNRAIGDLLAAYAPEYSQPVVFKRNQARRNNG